MRFAVKIYRWLAENLPAVRAEAKIHQNPSFFKQKSAARTGLVLGAPSELSERIALALAVFSVVSSNYAFNLSEKLR